MEWVIKVHELVFTLDERDTPQYMAEWDRDILMIGGVALRRDNRDTATFFQFCDAMHQGGITDTCHQHNIAGADLLRCGSFHSDIITIADAGAHAIAGNLQAEW